MEREKKDEKKRRMGGRERQEDIEYRNEKKGERLRRKGNEKRENRRQERE